MPGRLPVRERRMELRGLVKELGRIVERRLAVAVHLARERSLTGTDGDRD